MGLPGDRAQHLLEHKDAEEALGWCNRHRYSESWSIIDNAVVIYNLDDPPAWLPETDEDGNSVGGVGPPSTPERTAQVAFREKNQAPS